MANDSTLLVHSFESLAARDGEGLRYGIFLSGCPLRCAYCHNPDTWNMQAASRYTAEDIVSKIRRYRPYFQSSGGGVTLSGGEPLLQAEALCTLGELLGRENIGYTVDTSGAVPLTDAVRRVLLSSDLVILDVKFADEKTFKRYTGGDFSLVEQTLRFLAENGVRLWVRTVVVPGINDTEEALDAYLSFLRPFRESILKYELLAFHTMGFYKYEGLGIENPLAQKKALDPNVLKALQEYVNKEL